MFGPIVRGLLATSPEIERQPLWKRPRFMAAAWAGLLVCKLYAMAFVSFEYGLVAFSAILAVGAGMAAWRFGARAPRITRPGESGMVAASPTR